MQPSESGNVSTGVVVCSCGGRIMGDGELSTLLHRLSFAGFPSSHVLTHDSLCAPAGREALEAFATKRGLGRLVCAGCSPATNRDVLAAAALVAGITPGSVRGVAMSGRPDSDAHEIRKALEALAATPLFETRTITLEQAVLVVGSGAAARHAATRIASLGHPVTLAGEAAPAQAKGAAIAAPEEVRLLGLEGHVGAFRAHLAAPGGAARVSVGAVVVASDAGVAPDGAAEVFRRFGCAEVVALGALQGVLATLPRVSRVRTVGIVLDLDTEETRAGTERALETARALQRTEVCQVHLFAHDARVAAPGLQELYDAARNAGVTVVKYDGRLAIGPDGDGGVWVGCFDAGLGADARYSCDLVGVSPLGLAATEVEMRARGALAEALGVGTDSLGRLQENNIHLLPVLSSRTGVFVAASPRGQHYHPDALLEVEAAVAAAHALLAPGTLNVELSHAVVDEDKCALCLTCVRACPHRAMGINPQKKAAEAAAEACRRCGICAGECPAKAITLPASSDAALLAQLGIGRERAGEKRRA